MRPLRPLRRSPRRFEFATSLLDNRTLLFNRLRKRQAIIVVETHAHNGDVHSANPCHDDRMQLRRPMDSAAPTAAQLGTAARTFALLGSPVRLHLVRLAADGDLDVGTLAKRAGVSIATASQHLAKLRLAGLISARRVGRHHIYTVDDPHVRTLVEQIFEHIAPDGSLAPDPD